MNNPENRKDPQDSRLFGMSDEKMAEWIKKTQSKKRIPAEIIDVLLAETGLPKSVRRVGASTARIFEVVADLKAARELGKSPKMHWPELKYLLDWAFENDEWSALDDLERAWKTVVPMPFKEIIGGVEYVYGLNAMKNDPLQIDLATYKYQEGDNHLNTEILNQKRCPVSWLVVESVRQLQRDLERIPFRSEILDMVTYYRPDEGMDEQELSRQLKKLGLAEWIPDKRKKSTTKCEAEQDHPEER